MAKYGFNVTIGADTRPFATALRALNTPIQEAQTNLKKIADGLKINPLSTQLLAQKQQALQNEIARTEKKAQGLREALLNLDKEQQQNGSLTLEQKEKYNALLSELYTTEEELKNLQKEYKNFGSVGAQQIAAVGAKMQDFGGKITEVGKKLSVISAGAASLLGVGLKYDAEIERSTKAFSTFMGSAEEAADAVEKIRKEGEKSPFNTSDLIKANQMLVTTGVDAETTRKTINGLADAIALTGGGNDELTRMAANLQQIKNAGKATAIDIRQFAYAGIDVYGALSAATGKTTEEIKGSAVTFEDLSKALILASQEGGKYYKGQEAMSETLSGSLTMLKKSFQDLLGQLSEHLVPVIVSITEKVQGLIDWIRGLDEGQKAMLGQVLVMVAALGPLLVIIGSFITKIGMFLTFAPKVVGIFKSIGTAITVIKTAASGLFAFLAANPIVLIIGAVVAVIAALVLLYNKCEWFRNGVNAVFTAVKDFVVNVFTAIGNFFTVTVPGWIEFLTGEVLPHLPYYIGYMVGFILGKIVQFIGNVWNFITTKVPQIITSVITFVATLPGKLWAVFTQVLSKVREWLGNWLSTVAQKIPEIVNSIKEKFLQLPGQMLSIGRNIVEGLWNGIKNAAGWIKEKVGEFAKGILDGMKEALKIGSPSKLFRDEVGRYIAEGIGVGFNKNIGNVLDSMQNKLNVEMGSFSIDDITVPSNNNTSPVSIVINTQELDSQKLEQIVGYVNRRFGASY